MFCQWKKKYSDSTMYIWLDINLCISFFLFQNAVLINLYIKINEMPFMSSSIFKNIYQLRWVIFEDLRFFPPTFISYVTERTKMTITKNIFSAVEKSVKYKKPFTKYLVNISPEGQIPCDFQHSRRNLCANQA